MRQDNADLRLTPLGHKLGLADDQRLDRVHYKQQRVEEIRDLLKKTSADKDELNRMLQDAGSAKVSQKQKLYGLLSRPELSIQQLISGISSLQDSLKNDSIEVLEQVEIQTKYEGYIEKEKEAAEKLGKLNKMKIGTDFNYKSVSGLSSEAFEKLSRLRPSNLGQASRVSGVTPADISVLMVFLNKN